MCERPLGCAENYELPPLSPALTVERSFTADRAKWVAYEWSQCSVRCGKGYQTRKVLCSTGQDHECQFGVKPATEKECREFETCNKWIPGPWSGCSVKCGKGYKNRTVTCSNADETECFGDKPETSEPCKDFGPHCSECKVHLYGNPDFSGWRANFIPGSYNTEELLAHGAKCEEVSSIRVVGECCLAKVYQYGDFNSRNAGWEATLRKGDHDLFLLGEAGVKNNDVSSMKVEFDDDCGKPSKLRRSSSSSGDDAARPGESRADADRRREERLKRLLGADGAAGDVDGSGKQTEANGRTPTLGAAQAQQYPWWFWVLIAVLVIIVISGVYLAVRRRGTM
jgi:hypothetical protein